MKGTWGLKIILRRKRRREREGLEAKVKENLRVRVSKLNI
jgi:hypothetical protein